MRTLYIVGPEDKGEGFYFLLTEEGSILANNFCNNYGHARNLFKDRLKEILEDGYELLRATNEDKEHLIKVDNETLEPIKKYRTDEQYYELINDIINGNWQRAGEKGEERGFYAKDLVEKWQPGDCEMSDLVYLAELIERNRH